MNHILVETIDQILIAKINRPDKLNALNRSVIGELNQVIDQLVSDDEVKGLIITGVGEKAFAAGADISEFQNYPKEEAILMAKKGLEVFGRLENSTKPVIAAVNGFCLGGGFELALGAHIRIASENAKFGLPEVNLGLIPGYGGTQRLTMLVGKARAFEMVMTGDMINAERAEQLGVVNHVVALDELLDKALEIMKKITAKAPLAIAEAIKAINTQFEFAEKGFERESESFGYLFETEDFKEGVGAFLEKRKPEFKKK